MTMLQDISTISPIDGHVIVQRRCASMSEIQAVLSKATFAQKKWSRLSIAERCAHVTRAVKTLVESRAGIAEDITRQMGRPIRYKSPCLKNAPCIWCPSPKRHWLMLFPHR
jgi:acyl-CoA reductase-like NAD-dependent aldehyde dehydrogenase